MIDLQFITFLSLLPLSEEISFVHYQGRNIFRDVIIPTEVLIMMREIFRKKSKLEVSAVSEVAPWKFALSVFQLLLSLNDVWKLMFPCALVLMCFWPGASACGRGVQRNGTNAVCSTAPQSASLVAQLPSPPSSLCFIVSSVFAPEWIILYPRHLWNRFQHPHSPIQASLPPCACAYFIFCQESILLIPPAGQRLFYVSVQCLFLHEAFPPMSTFSKPMQKAASRGGRKLIFVVLWTWESHLSPAIYLQAGGAWSVTEAPCLPFSVSNFHPLRILWGVNVTADTKALI